MASHLATIEKQELHVDLHRITMFAVEVKRIRVKEKNRRHIYRRRRLREAK